MIVRFAITRSSQAALTLLTTLLLVPLVTLHAADDSPIKKPNILFILADDLGYGDVSCYNPDSKIPTPNIDRLAAEGMRFTDAHSPSTVCTPTRYSLLTGRMAFRTKNNTVFTGVGGPCLIEPSRMTIADMLASKGYHTAMFGKWHVGMTFYDSKGKPINHDGPEGVERVDYSRRIDGGPMDQGFARFFGTVCCPTSDFLYAYIDNDHIPVAPTGKLDRSLIPKNPFTGDCRDGVIAPDYKLNEVDLVFLDKAKAYLQEHVKTRSQEPFFLLHSFAAVHLASLPAPQFMGATKFGPHGDYIYEMDWIVGELMKTLTSLGIADNTIVMIGSDNGPEVSTVVEMRKTYNHDGASPWRGVKRDQWEGGHRTPFIVRWPKKIKAGTLSNQLLSLTDVFATCAAIVGAEVPKNAAEDSFNLLPVLLGTQGEQSVRPYLLQQTWTSKMSIRRGNWKYCDHQGSGGNNYERGEMKEFSLPEKDSSAPGQLYNLADDPGEITNVYSQHPEIVSELKALLDSSKEQGRSASSNSPQ